MRKLIVSNLVTLDGYYEGPDRTVDSLFDYFSQDYKGVQTFDAYNTERLCAADTLLLSGCASFLSNKGYWTSVPNDPKATPIRREFAQRHRSWETQRCRQVGICRNSRLSPP